MDSKQSEKLRESLRKIYEEENKRIVFWFDKDREFENDIHFIGLEGVSIINLKDESAFGLKVKLETEDTTGRYLLYAPFAEPEPEADWLMDIRLYSRTFYADMASMILNELELSNLSMREHIGKRQEFCANKDRVAKLKKFVSPDDLADDIDLKMLAVITKADQSEPFNILMKLLSQYCKDGDCDLSQPPKAWEEIEKFGLSDMFWELMAKKFGYNPAEKTLLNLTLRIFVADMENSLKGDLPFALKHFQLQNRAIAQNASVFLSQWRNNVTSYDAYKMLSKQVGEELNIKNHINLLDENDLAECMTFEAVERKLIRSLRDTVMNRKYESIDGVKTLIQKRRDGFWANPRFAADGDNIETYNQAYQAIEAAAELFELRKRYEDGFDFPDAKSMYDAYAGELFVFDQLYRKFNFFADRVELLLKDGLKPMREAVEACYCNWYLEQMAVAWNGLLEKGEEKSLLNTWRLPEISRQKDFYDERVGRVLGSVTNKVYVIVSDALRYEVAEELYRVLCGKNRFDAKLETQMGVLPSYTGLGMAALLPKKELAFKLDANADVLVDGMGTSSIDQRAKVLAGVDGTAIKADALLGMKRDEGREFVKDLKVIYIYHNRIDSTGDSAATETETFEAVEKTIEELAQLVSHIINNLNGNHVVITADHGFLYQQSMPEATDKSGLDTKPTGTLKAKKRYLLGTNLGESPKVFHGKTAVTAGADGDMEFWIPKGANKFHFVGGSRFIHGGAMLQEIVVPVITVKELHGEKAKKAVADKVGVSLLGGHKKVVTPVHRFEFIQNEAVTDRMKPRILTVAVYDGENIISNEETLTFDSQSDSMEERKKEAKLTLLSGKYSGKKDYHLVLRNADTQTEYERFPIIIDIAISNDF